MRIYFLMAALTFKGLFSAAQSTPHPGQPASGPGGADYQFGSVLFFDHAKKADGYWLFVPSEPRPDTVDVVVFLHGYGAYNPFAYGKWIKHLVAKGNAVIYPRYQKNLFIPTADKFPEKAATGIRNALSALRNDLKIVPRTDRVMYIGHSYGGVVAANLGVNYRQFNIPKPKGMLLSEPGTGPLTGARLTDYSGLPEDLALNIVVGEDDYVVGSEFAKLVFQTAVNTPMRNILVQRRDSTGPNPLRASHHEPYSHDPDFDTGLRNYTAKRVLYVSRLDQVDYYCYWKLADAIMGFTRDGLFEDYAFGNTPRQRFMGRWEDGRPIRPLDVYLPGTLRPGPPVKPKAEAEPSK